MAKKPYALYNPRIAYKVLSIVLAGLATLLIVLPGVEWLSGGGLKVPIHFRPILLASVAMMLALSRVGRFTAKSLPSIAPLILIGLIGLDLALSFTGCEFPGGLHPINAIGVAAVSAGLARTIDTQKKENEQ